MALSNKIPKSSEKSGLLSFRFQDLSGLERAKLVFKVILAFLTRESKDFSSVLMTVFKLTSERIIASVATSVFARVRSFPFKLASFSVSRATLSSQ